jgi:hypothetical protein
MTQGSIDWPASSEYAVRFIGRTSLVVQTMHATTSMRHPYHLIARPTTKVAQLRTWS